MNSAEDCNPLPSVSTLGKWFTSRWMRMLACGALLASGLAVVTSFAQKILVKDLSQVPDEWLFSVADGLDFSGISNNAATVTSWLATKNNSNSPAGLFYRFALLNCSTDPNNPRALATLEAELKTNCPPEVLILQSAHYQFLALVRQAFISNGMISNVVNAATDAFYQFHLNEADIKLLLAAQLGHRVAQSKLGDRYLGLDSPTSLPGDSTEGLRWHYKAGSQGCERSQEKIIALVSDPAHSSALPDDKWPVVLTWAERLGKTNANASFVLGLHAVVNAESESDFGKALKLLARAAEQGSGAAYYSISKIHLAGLTGKQDLAAAKTALLKGAEKDHLPCLIALGEWEFEGVADEDVQPNYAKARQWFEKAAMMNNPSALYHLGILEIMEKLNYVSARPYFEQAAELGHLDAKLYLAMVLEYDASSPEVMGRVVELYTEVAEAGSPRAQYALARLIAAGILADTPPAQAIPLYLEAAHAGYSPAQLTVALLFEEGNGVSKSIPEMMRWFELAANNGDATTAGFVAKWYGQFPNSEEIVKRFRALEQSNIEGGKKRRAELFPNHRQ